MNIKGRPCKVLSISVSKTGKHGHAKCNFETVDIFNGKVRGSVFIGVCIVSVVIYVLDDEIFKNG